MFLITIANCVSYKSLVCWCTVQFLEPEAASCGAGGAGDV